MSASTYLTPRTIRVPKVKNITITHFVSEITNRRDLTVLFSVTESWARGRVEWARPRVQLTV